MLLQIHPPSIQFVWTSVSRWTSIRVPGVIIDQHLTFDNHVSKLVQSCKYHLRGLCHIRQLLTKTWPIHCRARSWVADLTIVTPCFTEYHKQTSIACKEYRNLSPYFFAIRSQRNIITASIVEPTEGASRLFGWTWLYSAPLYRCRNWQWIYGAVSKYSDWLIDWLISIVSGKSLRYCRSAYLRLKDEVFHGGPPYNPIQLETFLKEVFGEKTSMSQYTHPSVMVTSVLADRWPTQLHLFRNYARPGVQGAVDDENQWQQPWTGEQ